MPMPARNEILKWLYERLKPKRFLHTLGVEQEALQLARIHGIPLKEASTAALLHDCAKNLSTEKLLAICKDHNINLHNNEEYPQLLHAFAAPYVAQKQFGTLPEDVCNALRFHTTGRAGMSPLEELIYSADYAELGRDPFPGLEEARKRLIADLSDGTHFILQNTVKYLESNHSEVFPMTMQALESYKDRPLINYSQNDRRLQKEHIIW
ncbi:MAG: bis(5'-nucleosyl)-tetraphosphatase (symmetrical) YqeK [Firmicutes bacterium]|nr:bis(5'-nucleosyl)-tetraphosphatase (symmetrical) YqeK [Bacillota bacterium]